MRLLLATCSVLALNGCVALGLRDAPASQEDVHAARDLFTVCLAHDLAGLDDHTSDAGTIAHALSLHCPDEWRHYSAVLQQGMSRSRQRLYIASEVQTRREIALQVVLRERAPKSGQPPAAPAPTQAPRKPPSPSQA